MKKLLSCFLLALALAGCGDKSPQSVKPGDMKEGYVHFAANLILEDIIHRGDASIYAQLAPARVISPYRIMDAERVIDDFRHNFAEAEDKYQRLRGSGTVVRGTVSHVDKDSREIVFSKEARDITPAFTGVLRISLDRDFYRDGNVPDYAAGATGTFMCMEYRPVHDFKNESTHKIEVRLIQCKTADDYYAVFQDKIKERLADIYHGREPVNPALAKGLAALYLTGQSVPEDSVCLQGSFLSCHENLVEEFARKWGEVKAENVGAMHIDPEKTTSRKFEQVKSGPAERPENADRSPSGEKIHERSETAKKQKEAVSQVKVPGTK